MLPRRTDRPAAKHLRGAEWKTLSIARGQSTQFEKKAIGNWDEGEVGAKPARLHESC